MSLKLGVFGYGFIAGVHVEALSHMEGVEIEAVCGPRAEAAQAFADKHGITRVVTDIDGLLEDDGIAGVLVDTPDATHYKLVMRSLAAGKHVFCEKPLARTVEEAREMLAAARAGRRRTVVGFSNRWRTQFGNVKARLDAGEIGDVVHVHAQSFNASLVRSDRPRFSWRTDADRTGTGILGDLGAHYIDLTHFLLGQITDVCADLSTVVPAVYDEAGVAHEHRVDDDSIFLMKLARGGRSVHGTMGLSRLGSVHADFPVGRRHYLIDGMKGGILLENDDAWLYRPDGSREAIPGDPPMTGHSHGGALLVGATRQMETFVTAIQEDREVSPSFVEGLQCQEVLHACVESSKARAWTKVEQVAA
jgi:predicted dehydrogenase